MYFPVPNNSTELFSTEYSLDNIGRITQIIEHVPGDSDTLNYTYDLSGRLEHVFRNDTLISSYGYDSNGNRLFHASQTDTLFGNYDDQDRMLSYGNSTYNYNARGSLTFKVENGDTTFYQYDLMGNLISVNLPDGDLIEYLIDAQNRRVGKKVNGIVERQWIYQDQLNPIAELDGSGNLIARFVYGDKGHVPAYMIKAGVIYRYVTDHLGSVRLIVNTSSSEIVQQLSYDEFGNVLSNTNPDFQPFAFAGGLYDTQTKLVRFGARDYDAFTGRWTAKDPIGFWGGSNIFVYVHNSPTNLIDPMGLYEDILAVGWAIAIAEPSPVGEIIMAAATTAALIGQLVTPDQVDVFNYNVCTEAPDETKEYEDKEGNKYKYKPPKNYDGKPDSEGNYPTKGRDTWGPKTTHGGSHSPHHDIQHPNGTHTPVYPVD